MASTSRFSASGSATEAAPGCLHCGQPVHAAPTGEGDGRFCCPGCASAYDMVRGLGLDSYYARRSLDPDTRPPTPDGEAAAPADVGAWVRDDGEGRARLHLMIDGLHCAACVWLIEAVLARQPGVVSARLNMSTRRLTVVWDPRRAEAGALVAAVTRLGYRVAPYDPVRLGGAQAEQEKALLRALAVAGFAAGNIMLLSVGVWAGHSQGMGVATRDLMHWLSALIAIPAVAYAGQPFFRSALAALRHGRTNMDVPISVGVLLTLGISLFATSQSGAHAYFEAATMLLFFLLIGRYLDARARGRARATAEHLLTLGAAAVTVLDADGRSRVVPPDQVRAGDLVLAAAGDRIPVDGTVEEGRSDLDTSLITGESLPQGAEPGTRVFAGTLNLSAPLRLRVAAVGEGTLLAEIIRLMEVAEQGRARYVAIADRVSRAYTPVVHLLGLAAFLLWAVGLSAPWDQALMIAAAVLIITCPCALALAVPVVQVLASGRLLKRGILLKSATALERLETVDTVVFDKTGTLTVGRPDLVACDGDGAAKALAASLAGASRHPLARALVRAVPGVAVAEAVEELPGRGLLLNGPAGPVRLGSRRWIGIAETSPADALGDAHANAAELWLDRPGQPPVRFAFADALRPDAEAVVAALRRHGYRIELLSGDRPEAVAPVAERLGIEEWQAAVTPSGKVERLERLAAEGRTVLMVGDGLNDAPALAAAAVSLSPTTAADVSQTAADAVFQGDRLAPVIDLLDTARRSDRLVRQNFALSFGYNLVTIPLAFAGFVTPLIAAVAMSASSVAVILNALRLNRDRSSWTSSST